jgi:hypothetical protein
MTASDANWRKGNTLLAALELMAIEVKPVIKSSAPIGWRAEDRVLWHLSNWKLHMQPHLMEERNLGAPKRASGGIGISHTADFEQLADNADRVVADWIDAIILDLPAIEQKALRCEYLYEKWESRTPIHLVLVLARESVRRGMDKRGIV